MIELLGVSKKYKHKIVLKDINLTIKTGEFLVLRGESGAGKSTLLNIIAGTENPTAGKILYDGKDIKKIKTKEKSAFYQKTIGNIFQGFYLQPQLTISENIQLPGIFAGVSKKKREERAEKLAKELGIFDELKSLPSQISGGQAERACIARALFMSPKIILADEITNNLDEKNIRKVLGLLKEVQNDYGVTIIMSSHDKIVSDFATREILIKDSMVQNEA